MKKIALLAASVVLWFCLAGCGVESGQAPSAPPDEGSAAQDLSPGSAGSLDSTAPPQSTLPDVSMEGHGTGGASADSEECMVRKISVKSDEYEIIYELNDSQAAKDLYGQLPLTTAVEPFSNNEMTFYPPEKLDTADTPLSSGEAGTLSYYAPWGDVVMFYDDCNPNGSLYGLGTVISGGDDISKLTGSITISVCG